MTKIFITGITGYIAGDAFYALYKKHPNLSYSALIRTQEKANKVTSAYPNLRPVIGGLDDSKLIEDEVFASDIVLHAADASDHEGAAKAIAAGLARKDANGKSGYWLHTGGSGILTYFDSRDKKLGEWNEKEFNDWSGVDELVSLPDEAFHRNVDEIVLETAAKYSDRARIALLCPPTIYGKGRGPVATRGRQVYELAKLTLEKEYAPIIGEGKARWNHIHVHDLSALFVALVEAAIGGRSEDGLWGEKAYYFVERGEHVWGDLAKKIAEKAAELGLIKKDWKEQSLEEVEALDVAGFEAVSWGLNSRGKGERAKRLLGWKPAEHDIFAEIPEILKQEEDRLN